MFPNHNKSTIWKSEIGFSKVNKQKAMKYFKITERREGKVNYIKQSSLNIKQFPWATTVGTLCSLLFPPPGLCNLSDLVYDSRWANKEITLLTCTPVASARVSISYHLQAEWEWERERLGVTRSKGTHTHVRARTRAPRRIVWCYQICGWPLT